MILVVTEQLDLRFVLQHQGRFIRSARTASDALRILRSTPGSIQGIVLDERVANSRLVAGYARTHAPGIRLVSWRLAQRHSPFRNVREEQETRATPRPITSDGNRYVWERNQSQQ